MNNNSNNNYRDDLPPVPERMLQLPVQRGYPVPWFVSEVDGQWDFRVVDARKFKPAVEDKLCWVCGSRLGSVLAITLGPMCAVNRVISEPPSHRECAEFSIKACPFLTQKQNKRNTANLPADAQPAPGMGIARQPGAVLLWLTKSYTPFDAGNGVLFKVGDPIGLFWFREGREATRAEVLESVETGLPILREAAGIDGFSALKALDEQIAAAYKLLPPETPVRRPKFGVAAKRKS